MLFVLLKQFLCVKNCTKQIDFDKMRCESTQQHSIDEFNSIYSMVWIRQHQVQVSYNSFHNAWTSGLPYICDNGQTMDPRFHFGVEAAII